MMILYVIGNGFDLYHGLNTRYQSFAYYLAESDEELFELLNTYYGLPDIRLPTTTDEEYGMWSKFEQVLAELDYENVLEDHSDLMANPAAEDFRDRDWHSYQIEMESIINRLTSDLKKEFCNFIISIDYDKDIENQVLDIKNGNLYLNFNYTETLQRFYEIKTENIFYIHNKADRDSDTIILGHGTDPKDFKEPEELAPEGLTEEELEEWKERQADDYDYSYESAKQEILGYYFRSFKNTEKIIEENREFFGSLQTIESVFILGHSLSPVDIKYFYALKDSLPENTQWVVTYFSDYEKQQHLSALEGLGLSPMNIRQVRIQDLKAGYQSQYKLEL